MLKIPIADDVKGRDINVEVHPKRMSVTISGETVLQGQYDSNSNDPMVDPDGIWAQAGDACRGHYLNFIVHVLCTSYIC